MTRPQPQPVENYTNAFLTSFGGLLFMTLWVVAAIAGYLWVAALASGLNYAISLLGRFRDR